MSADGVVVEPVVEWRPALEKGPPRGSWIRDEQGRARPPPWRTPTSRCASLGAFLHEPDGAVIRARLIGEAARSLDAGMLDEHIAYLTSDAALTSPSCSPSACGRPCRPNPKAISAVPKAQPAPDALEIKKRGVDVDPAAFRKKLMLRGDQRRRNPRPYRRSAPRDPRRPGTHVKENLVCLPRQERAET